ncbi:MAG: chemotaxis protein CheA [Halanaerobiales bacterium]
MSNNFNNIDDEFLQDFIIETQEHLETIEMNVLDLETEPDNGQVIHSLFRAFHTIKGLAGFVDQDLIQQIAHMTETILDICRKESLNINKEIANIILDSSDLIGEICNDINTVNDEDFIRRIRIFLDKLKVMEYKLEKKPLPEDEKNTENTKDKDGIKDTEDLEDEKTIEDKDNIEDVENVEDIEATKDADSLNAVDDLEDMDEEEDFEENQKKRIGEILLEDHAIDEKDLEFILRQQKKEPELKFGQIAVKEKKAKAKDVVNGIRKQNACTSSVGGGIIRIPTKKVDNLVDMMGELIITQSQIEQEAENKFDSNDSFFTKLLNMSRIMKEMQNLSMSLRMISLRSTFQKLARIARDTIDELDKDVNVIFEGEDTEIDRNIAEKLLKPLVHLVKNSISHGIEVPGVRKKRSKPVSGKVKISAYSNKGSVYIEISDDGNGIDLDKVYNKALEKGLISSSKKYSEKEIEEFIFLPGFSTNENVDTVSGRGVGMDVVKTEISRIGGKIELDNRPGEGCTFILKIPINLAVMNGTIVSIYEYKYILPTLNIKQILQLKDQNWVNVRGKKSMIRLRESVIPVIQLSRLLDREIKDKSYQDSEIVIVMEMDNQLKALPVDDIIGRREIVVKPMNEEFSNLDYISGASILGDGTVSLILDIEYLFKFNEDSQ